MKGCLIEQNMRTGNSKGIFQNQRRSDVALLPVLKEAFSFLPGLICTHMESQQSSCALSCKGKVTQTRRAHLFVRVEGGRERVVAVVWKHSIKLLLFARRCAPLYHPLTARTPRCTLFRRNKCKEPPVSHPYSSKFLHDPPRVHSSGRICDRPCSRAAHATRRRCLTSDSPAGLVLLQPAGAIPHAGFGAFLSIISFSLTPFN